MTDYLIGHYNYWMVILLMMVGLYTVISRHNLLKKLAGLAIFQTAVFLLYISIGAVQDATLPIRDQDFSQYANPLPQVLMLTAIVVGVATSALGFALVVRIHKAYGSVEENDIKRQDHEDV